MSTKTSVIFKTLHIATWIIFFGLCIKTGTLIFTLFFSLFINPVAAQDLHMGLDLSQLMAYDTWNYVSMVTLLILNWGLKAFLFYWIIKIFLRAKETSPFTIEVTTLISRVGFAALSIGVVSILITVGFEWLNRKGLFLSNLWEYTNGGGEFLLTAAIVFAIAQVFKRGVEIQSENELTV